METRTRLRRIAADRGVSMAALIREAIDATSEQHAPRPRSLGVGASGTADTARLAGGQRLTPGALVALLADIESGAYRVADLEASDCARARELLDRYADADIGFVDAAAFALVERLGESKLATLDRPATSRSCGPVTGTRSSSYPPDRAPRVLRLEVRDGAGSDEACGTQVPDERSGLIE